VEKLIFSLYLKDTNDVTAALTLLLNNGANIDAQDAKGNTPLLLAISQNKRFVPILLKFNPNLELTNRKGQTAYDVLRFKFSLQPNVSPQKQKIQEALLEHIKPRSSE